MRVLVDTDVVSYAFRKDDVFESFYGPRLVGLLPHVSFMTIAEIEYGVRRRSWGERRQSDMRDFIAQHFSTIDPTLETSQTWGKILAEAEMSGRHLKDADGWVAATALYHDMPLMTNNRRDFEFIPGLQLITQDGSA
ncbi:MAG: PIN domain-containing protein [Planctomycetota bacterium]